ncbi:MAG: hypothetical protein AB8H79_08080 [Myxococcota bacterium]
MRPTVRNTLVLGTALAAGCVFSSLDGIATVSQIPNPFPGLLAITKHKVAVVVDLVPVDDTFKSFEPTLKAFKTDGTEIDRKTLAELAADYDFEFDCDRIVSLSDGVDAGSDARQVDTLVMHCSSGQGYRLYVPWSSPGSMYILGVAGVYAGHADTRRYTDFSTPNWDGAATQPEDEFTTDQRKRDAAVFIQMIDDPDHICHGVPAPFLAWSNGRPLFLGQEPIDLSDELGCAPPFLRLSIDETLEEWAILANNKLLFMRWKAHERPEVTGRLQLEVDVGEVYADVGSRHGQVALAKRSTSGKASIELMERANLRITDRVAARKVVAVDIHGPGFKKLPHLYFVGQDGSGTYGIGQMELLLGP